MKTYIYHIIFVLFFFETAELKSQIRNIPIKEFWSYTSQTPILLNENPLEINENITLEESYFGLFFKKIKLIKNKFLEIDGYICKKDTVICDPVEGLRIFTARKKKGFLIDTINFYTYKISDSNIRQDFKIRLNIFNSDYLYIYGPGFLLDEFNIYKLRRKKTHP